MIEKVRKLKDLQRSASDIKEAVTLFQEADTDGTGELEIDEFRVLLDRVGIDVDEQRLKETLELYDSDGGGSIGLNEFILFLRSQYAEATGTV